MSQTVSTISNNPSLETALGSLELDLDSELRRYRRQIVTAGDRPEMVDSHANLAGNKLKAPQPDVIDVVSEVETASSNSSFSHISLPTPENPSSYSPEVLQALESLQEQGGGEQSANEELLNLENRDVLPQDYLDSSEELLKTLERDGETPESAAKDVQWTPLRASLVGAGIVGLTLLLFAILFPNVLFPSASQDVADLEATDASTGEVSPALAPTTVNLASEEFLDLSLDNLSVVDPNEAVAIAPTAESTNPNPNTEATPVPQPTPIPEPLVPPTGREDLASALLPPSLRPQPLTPFPVTPQVAATQPTTATPLVTPDGLKIDYYYVIFRNTSSPALTKAQTQVSDAFIRTFPTGRAIQLAEVSTAGAAESLVQKFRSAQIAAEIYHHQLTPAP
ncbi:hypothetical protein [[Limnothrix rosea] IAM M-220]|uniref:hypothetical protein n=1 Tax=[Limnothrix rosea] IAM M-220 TaxID=454133 RepID=UPI00096633EB|nr:hypothetical protein [[Limnothrix rosea] IAM M-220]OKH18173.1 hypothetical protein NIES208_06515 [[Limnothrix rosea] IAM M-220]